MATGAIERRSRFTLRDHLLVSCLWFAYNVQWGALLPIVLPAQIALLAGDSRKELANGIIPPAGALLAMFVAPLAGALSDRSPNPRGRRRNYLLSGAILNCVFLLAMARFGAGSSLWLYALCFACVQFTSNWWGGPYAGIIPDVAPREEHATASGWMMIMTAAGTIAGAVVAGVTLRFGYLIPYGFIAATIAVCLALTLAFVHEPPGRRPPDRLNLSTFLRGFLLRPSQHPDFYWVLVTRGLVSMGMFSVYTFFLYFLRDVVHLVNPEQNGSLLLGAATILSMPAALIAGKLSDRHGRKIVVQATGAMMAVMCGVYALISFHPSWPASIVIAILFGAGSCAYQAVDWALALDVLPSLESSGKDMGVWHVSLVLPQVIAPFITGVILNALNPVSKAYGYTAAFTIAALWFALGSIFVQKIRAVR